MVKQLCSKCGKYFNQNEKHVTSADRVLGRNENKPICYKCALYKLTGDNPPEISDFNTALIISGEMDDRTWEYLQEDLRSTEECRLPHYDAIDRKYDRYDDPAWCYTCNRDIAFCLCICYKCYEKLEDCTCKCPICDTPQSDGLCNKCDSQWDETRQGKKPVWSNEVDTCIVCGIKFYNKQTHQIVFVSSHEHKCPNCR